MGTVTSGDPRTTCLRPDACLHGVKRQGPFVLARCERSILTALVPASGEQVEAAETWPVTAGSPSLCPLSRSRPRALAFCRALSVQA